MRWATVSTGGCAWGWGRLWGRGSLLLLTPAAWISLKALEAAWSPSSFISWVCFLICIWGVRSWVGDGLGDSRGGASKLGISLGLLHHPFTQTHTHAPCRGNHIEVKFQQEDDNMMLRWETWMWGKSRFTHIRGERRQTKKQRNKQQHDRCTKVRDGEKNGLQKPRIRECDATHETMMKSTV